MPPRQIASAAVGCLALAAVCGAGGPTLGLRAHAGPVSSGFVEGNAVLDEDADTLDDGVEDALAQRFAPIVYHGDHETSFPTTVDAWLARTHLDLIDLAGDNRRIQSGPLQQAQLLGQQAVLSGLAVSSNGARSRGKRVSFVLGAVPRTDQDAVPRPDEWVTYVHSYPNEIGGVTLQYWRAYTRNDATFLGIDFGHGGDWEAIAVHLDAQQQVRKTTYLDHTGIVDVTRMVKWEHTHPLVWSEEGGHSSCPDARRMQSARWLRQETWTAGVVTRWDSARLGMSGGLRNIGEKTRPRNGQVFIQYSGLWGPVGRLFVTSGYWGPAFNETDAACADGRSAYRPYFRRNAERADCGRIFLRAWCDGIDGRRLDLDSECHATLDLP